MLKLLPLPNLLKRPTLTSLSYLLPLLSACGPLPKEQNPQAVQAKVDPAQALSKLLKLRLLEGGALRLRSQPTLLLYFATWCEECIRELPKLHNLEREEGLQVLGITLDPKPQEAMASIHQAWRPSKILLPDEENLKGESPFGSIEALPTSFLLDSRGALLEVFHGSIPVQHLRRRLKTLKIAE